MNYSALIDHERLRSCYHCGKCSSGCDVNRLDPSFQPHRLLHLMRTGTTERLLKEVGLWKCTTCFTCSERCPQGINLPEIIWTARVRAVGSGQAPPVLRSQREALSKTGRLAPPDNAKRKKAGLPLLQRGFSSDSADSRDDGKRRGEMKYALYLGCTTPVKALKYEVSARNLAGTLGVKLVDVPEFGCCGFPVKSMDGFAALLMAAHNLAVAEQKGLDIIGLCTGCVTILSEAKKRLKEENLRVMVNEKLKALGVKEYTGMVTVRHFARFLHEDYGLDRLREKVVNPQEEAAFAIHYGCHYAKPSHAHDRFDDPSDPRSLDELISVTGAGTIDYPNKNLCCGMTIMGTAEDVSIGLAAEKLDCLSARGVKALVVACPSCCIAYENNQKLIARKAGREFNIPVLYYTQIIGRAVGLKEKDLGFEFNRIKTGQAQSKNRA